jgi:hypothetical protein
MRQQRKIDYIVPLRRVVSSWGDDGAGCATRTVTSVAAAELVSNSPSPQEAATMTAASPPPAAAVASETAPPRKKSGPAKGWKKAKAAAVGAEVDADGRAATKMISIRLTGPQTVEIERWRAQFFDMDLAAAFRVLLDIALAARPREVIDPLGLQKATYQRVRQPKTKGSARRDQSS